MTILFRTTKNLHNFSFVYINFNPNYVRNLRNLKKTTLFSKILRNLTDFWWLEISGAYHPWNFYCQKNLKKNLIILYPSILVKKFKNGKKWGKIAVFTLNLNPKSAKNLIPETAKNLYNWTSKNNPYSIQCNHRDFWKNPTPAFTIQNGVKNLISPLQVAFSCFGRGWKF